jgi:hypothetical protein
MRAVPHYGCRIATISGRSTEPGQRQLVRRRKARRLSSPAQILTGRENPFCRYRIRASAGQWDDVGAGLTALRSVPNVRYEGGHGLSGPLLAASV